MKNKKQKIDDDMLYIIVYYYSIKEQCWRADVLDEENKIVDSACASCEPMALLLAKDFAQIYKAMRITRRDKQ